MEFGVCGQLGADAGGRKAEFVMHKEQEGLMVSLELLCMVMCIWSVGFGILSLPGSISGSHLHSLNYQSPLSLFRVSWALAQCPVRAFSVLMDWAGEHNS